MAARLDGVVVFKMSGSGNDFVLIDGRGLPATELDASCIRAICRRRTGLGADGLVVLEPGCGAGAVRFHFFNADGGRSDMCGNAALCATRMAAWLELAPRSGMLLDTDAGPVRSRCLDDTGEHAEIELPAPSALKDMRSIPLSPGERSMYFTSVGVPHLVVPVESLTASGLMERGRELRSHRAVGTGGANVNFVSSGGNGWAMRTYERGVEGETLACGTGAVATAAVLNLIEKAPLPVSLRTASGATLTVSAKRAAAGRLERPKLVGEARFVYRAILGGAKDCEDPPGF